jgi:glycosyltransferase involved in cell wall biosynthesis
VNLGLPVSLIQGIMTFQPELERAVFRAPCLKVCVSGWLVDVGRTLGVPEDQLVHVPMGIDHDCFTEQVPLRERPRRVGMLYGPHPAKGWALGLDALRILRDRRPDVDVVAFGTERPVEPLPPWVHFVVDPSREQLAAEVYNGCQVFLQPSSYEGFGFAAVEAMACGAALVTTDNGGSRDYAVDGQTALVSERSPEALADAVARLLDDPDEAAQLARAGKQHVTRFDWDRGAEVLEHALQAYLDDPDRFRGPPGDDVDVGPWTADSLLALTAPRVQGSTAWPPPP